MKVFVSVGTHEQPFQRLLDLAASALDDTRLSLELAVQFGVGEWSRDDAIASAYLTPAEMSEHLDWCDIFVSQASPGNVFSAIEHHRWPYVLGRRQLLGEHVDDHQAHFAAFAQTQGLCTNLDDFDDLIEALLPLSVNSEAIATLKERAAATLASRSQNSTKFRQGFWAEIL